MRIVISRPPVAITFISRKNRGLGEPWRTFHEYDILKLIIISFLRWYITWLNTKRIIYQYVLILTLLWLFLVGTISALILSPSPIIPRLTYLWSAWFKSPALIPTSLKVLLHCSIVGRCPRSLACWWWTYIWLCATLLHPHMLSTMVTLRNNGPPLLHINCGLSAGGGGRK